MKSCHAGHVFVKFCQLAAAIVIVMVAVRSDLPTMAASHTIGIQQVPSTQVQPDIGEYAAVMKKTQPMLHQIRRYGFTNETLLAVMARIPRHEFVPSVRQARAYHDSPLPIGFGQTISQPYIVAEMTRLLQLTKDSKVLEIGTGSGYQAAVLSGITPHVYSIEIIPELAEKAKKTLRHLKHDSVKLSTADGYNGWAEHAPFDAIIVTCASGRIPPPLIAQLANEGRMVIPVGRRFGTQYLILVEKDMDGQISTKTIMGVRFVPLTRKKS
jgi:protein-L-isoaspartate(D-aspartate) O-methyltransferase